jgi:hypothetical protein
MGYEISEWRFIVQSELGDMWIEKTAVYSSRKTIKDNIMSYDITEIYCLWSCNSQNF